MLSLHQLRTFLTVAQTGSVTDAAEQLVVSQPAVSSALASLQRDVGAALLERDGRGIRLSAAGERLVTYGRRIFALLEEATTEVRAAAGDNAVVRIAAVTTAAERLVPELLSGFEPGPQGAAVELYVANRQAVWDRLAHGEADLAIAGRPPDGRFVSHAVRGNALVVVGSATHRVDPTALGRATWLLREPGSGTRATTQALFEALGIAPRTVTIGSNAAIVGCVRAGLGVSLLSRDVVPRDVAEATIVEIPTPRTPLARDWHIAALANRTPTTGTRRFLDHVLREGTFAAAA